jgi:hypothetical protein
MEIFITPGSVILGITLYKPYFIREECKFLCTLLVPGLNLYFENFQPYRMLFFHVTLYKREIFSQKISGCNIYDTYVAKGLKMNARRSTRNVRQTHLGVLLVPVSNSRCQDNF